MSNTPPGSSGFPRKRPGKLRGAPVIKIQFVVDTIRQLFLDVVLVRGHSPERGGDKHEVYLYGNPAVCPNPESGVLHNLAHFHTVLLEASQGTSGDESIRVGKLVSYEGYIDRNGMSGR